MESSSSSARNPIGDGVFRCAICLDLIYKPVVLACGHISCFWCVYEVMHGVRASRCAICRQMYYHFPSICQLLHLLLLKMEPLAYKSREREILKIEKARGYFSPQFVDMFSENIHAEDELYDGVGNQVSVADVLCNGCKEVLFRPAVLNCGHVYCESCLIAPINGPLKCQVCHSIHTGRSPTVCLELDHFLEERFPKEYSARFENVQNMTPKCEDGVPSLSMVYFQGLNVKSSSHAQDNNSLFQEDLQNTHVGVGCDLCGMYPIIGKRYKCKDCKEKAGFDVCEACHHTSSKLPGRFNQQHTPDHGLVLDDSRLLSRILMLMRPLDSEASEAEADDA